MADLSGSGIVYSTDTTLARTGVGTMKLSGASASASLGVQNGSNLEYGAIGWDGSNSFVVGTQGAVNGGTARDTILGSATGATNGIYLATEATARWQIASTGLLRPVATASYDIGDSTHVVRDVYATLTHATGLPISTGVSGLGTNVATWLATPSSANLASAITDETGSGALVFATSPTLVTPVLGVATATSLNGNTFTTGTYTLTGAASKVLTFNNTLTLAGTDSTTMTFPSTSATIARTDAAQTFTGSQTIAALVGPVTITEAVGSSGLTITGATQTSSFPALSITQTWNNSGTTFKAAVVNVTNTASAAGSSLLDLQVGGVSYVTVDRRVGILASNAAGFSSSPSAPFFVVGNSSGGWLTSSLIATSNLTLTAGGLLRWGINNNWDAQAASNDTYLGRAAAADVQLGQDVNGAAVSQTLRACNGITGTDKTGGNLTIASGKGTGAGTPSSLIFQTPTVLGSGTTAQSLSTRLTIDSSGLTIADAMNVVLNATTGTKFGTATTQKLSFYGATPIVCAVLATGAAHTVDDVIGALQNLGLVKQS
jgi:hypothetical protein